MRFQQFQAGALTLCLVQFVKSGQEVILQELLVTRLASIKWHNFISICVEKPCASQIIDLFVVSLVCP